MPTVFVDEINGANASHHIINGWTITRTATVSEIAPSGNQNMGQIIAEAEAALVAVVGDRGSACPGISVATYLEQFVPEVVSTDTVKFKIIYKGYPLVQTNLEASLTNVESNTDKDGNLITLSYTYPAGYLPDPRKAGRTVTQGATISVPMPTVSFTFKFTITSGTSTLTCGSFSSTGYHTATQVATFLGMFAGCVNASAYAIGLINGAARTWMCSRVRGTSKDAGEQYDMEMTYEYRADTWDFFTVFKNPDDNLPPPDVVAGVGVKFIRKLLEVNFLTVSPGPN